MNLIAFGLFDTKTGNYGQPFFFKHVAECSRALRELLNDPAAMAARYPEDFQLHQLGIFFDDIGQFENHLVNHGTLVAFAAPIGAREKTTGVHGETV